MIGLRFSKWIARISVIAQFMSGQWWWAYGHGNRQTQGGFSNLVGHTLKSEAQKGLTWTFQIVILTTRDMLHRCMALCYSKTWPSLQAMILPTLINWFSSWRCRASWARIPDTDLAPAVTPFTSHPSSLPLPPSPVIHSWHVKLTSNLAVLQCVINLWDI